MNSRKGGIEPNGSFGEMPNKIVMLAVDEKKLRGFAN